MTTPAKSIARRLKIFGLLGLAAVGVAVWLIVAPPSVDSSTAVPAPDAGMAAATSDQLAKATAAQGVCYGWQLLSGRTVVSRGSNLGPGTAVDSDPARCPRWVEVRSSVSWTSSSSEASDSAWVTIDATGVDPLPESKLERFGLDNGAFVDEPAWAICQAALALPLLTTESGAVPPVPAASAGAAASPPPDAGSDFWRDRWGYVFGAAVLLALAALTIVIGLFERKHAHTRRAGRRKKQPAAAKPAAAKATVPRQATAPEQAAAPEQPTAPEQAAGT